MEDTHAQPFPAERPEIAVEPLDGTVFEVDCRELKWWGVVPELGQRSLIAEYWAPSWTIHEARDLRAVRRANVHGVDGVEIEVSKWHPEPGWRSASRAFGRLQPDKVEWLGLVGTGEQTHVETFLQKGFGRAFPDLSRNVRGDGLFERLSDGSIRSKEPHDDVVYSGAGHALVRIASGALKCVRVIGLEHQVGSWHCGVTDIYVAESGRTVLTRVYCYAGMEGFPTDPNSTITVDGSYYYSLSKFHSKDDSSCFDRTPGHGRQGHASLCYMSQQQTGDGDYNHAESRRHANNRNKSTRFATI